MTLQLWGVARLNKDSDDKFDVGVGKKLARAKAEKEAYVKFKSVLLKYEKTLDNMSFALDKALDKMDTHIKYQREYIKKSF